MNNSEHADLRAGAVAAISAAPEAVQDAGLGGADFVLELCGISRLGRSFQADTKEPGYAPASTVSSNKRGLRHTF